MIGLVSVTGVVASAFTGAMLWRIALPFAAGALAGMLGARQLAARLPGKQLQIGFAIVSAAVAIGMLVNAAL